MPKELIVGEVRYGGKGGVRCKMRREYDGNATGRRDETTKRQVLDER